MIEQGFHKTTMADVIRESGLSAGAVYGYFKSKEEIVAAIADDALSAVDELFEKHARHRGAADSADGPGGRAQPRRRGRRSGPVAT